MKPPPWTMFISTVLSTAKPRTAKMEATRVVLGPKFTVLRRVDAFADFVAEVEADSPEEAAAKASRHEERYEWKNEEIAYFDARIFVALDANSEEISGTEQGDF